METQEATHSAEKFKSLFDKLIEENRKLEDHLLIRIDNLLVFKQYTKSSQKRRDYTTYTYSFAGVDLDKGPFLGSGSQDYGSSTEQTRVNEELGLLIEALDEKNLFGKYPQIPGAFNPETVATVTNFETWTKHLENSRKKAIEAVKRDRAREEEQRKAHESNSSLQENLLERSLASFDKVFAEESHPDTEQE